MMERLLRDIYDAISSLRQRISYLETQDGVADLSDAMSFVQLTDAPDNYIGQAGKVVAVTAGEDGLEFVAGSGALADHDHSGDPGDGGTFDAANLTSGTAADGYVLTADGSGGAAWEAVSGGANELDDLTDVDLTTPPSDGQALVFDSGSSTWKAETLAGGVTDFLDLTDTPADYTDSAGFFVTPNQTEDGLEFTRDLFISDDSPAENGSLRIRRKHPNQSSIVRFFTGGLYHLGVHAANNSINTPPIIQLVKSTGTVDAPDIVPDGTSLGRLIFSGYHDDDIHDVAIGARLEAFRDGTGAAYGVLPGQLRIKTTFPNPADQFDSIVIRSTGNVGIGGETSPEDKLHVSGAIALNDITTPSTPSSDTHKIYAKSDGIYVLDSSGNEIGPLSTGTSLNVREVDGTPNVSGVDTIVVTNGTLTDDGGGQITLDFGSAATDGSAIHDNVSGEIAALTEKTTPANSDWLLVEDSEDSNSKKKVQVGNLPGGTGGADILEMQVFS